MQRIELENRADQDDAIERNLSCPICRDDFKEHSKVVRLACTHMFCLECLKQWLNQRNTCPLCRLSLPVEEDKDAKKKRESAQNVTELRESMVS